MRTHGRAAQLLAWGGGVAFTSSLAYFAYFFVAILGRRPAPPSALVPHLTVDLLLFAAFGAHHSLFARERAKRILRRWVPAAFERSVFVWVASALFALVCLAWRPVPGGEVYHLSGVAAWIGWSAQLLGVWVTLRTAARLDVLELAGIRQARDETRPPHLEIAGPYLWVRHPLYLGWMLIVSATPVMNADRLAFALISAAYLAIGIPWEERSLAAALGEPYRAYMARVRWRVIPYVY
jgi:protein-S-isoprenylcysteine O-methyltransferase Ste14